MTKYGELIKEFRMKNNLTQQDIGDILGISQQSIAKWEKGIAEPNHSFWEKLDEILEITKEEALGLNKAEINKNKTKINTLSPMEEFEILISKICENKTIEDKDIKDFIEISKKYCKEREWIMTPSDTKILRNSLIILQNLGEINSIELFVQYLHLIICVDLFSANKKGVNIIKHLLMLPTTSIYETDMNKQIAGWFLYDYYTGVTHERNATKTYEEAKIAREIIEDINFSLANKNEYLSVSDLSTILENIVNDRINELNEAEKSNNVDVVEFVEDLIIEDKGNDIL